MRIIISAFACLPNRGSEPGVGYDASISLARNHEVTIITDSANKPFIDPVISNLRHKQINFIFLGPRLMSKLRNRQTEWLYYLLWQIRAYLTAKSMHKIKPFDVAIHLTYVNAWVPPLLGLLSIPFLWFAGNLQTTPLKFLSMMDPKQAISESIRNLVLISMGKIARITASRTNTCVVTSSPQSVWGKNVKIIPSVIGGLSHLDVNRINKNAPLNKRFTQTFRVISVGRLLGWKGFGMGLRGFALFHQRFPSSEYWIIGDGPEKKYLTRLANHLRIQDVVRFVPWLPRDQVLEFLSQANVLLHPSLHETLGYVILEAMANACPVICLDTCGPSLVVDQEFGFKIKVTRPDHVISEISKCLSILAENSELQERMGIAALSHSRNWHLENRLTQIESWLQEIVLGKEK